MKHTLKILIAGSILLTGQLVLAQSAAPVDDATAQSYSVNALIDRYPAGSINSTDIAGNALTAVTDARAQIEARFAADQRACYPKFFTTSCLNKATERRRVDLSMVKPVEVEANAYMRQAKVQERDRNLAEKAAAKERDAASRELKGNTELNATGKEERAVSDAQRKSRADAYARKIADQAEKQRLLQENAATDAQERAANVARYEAKVRESKERQKQVAERKAEKERERANK